MQDNFWEIYFIEFDKEEFLFREISRREYKALMQAFPDVEDLEEAICKTAVFIPEDYDFNACPAGIPGRLAEQILVKSGFLGESTQEEIQQTTSKFQDYRTEMETLENQLTVIIVEAFPYYSLEEVERWPLSKVLWFVSRAEYALELRGRPIQITGLEQTMRDTAKDQPKTSSKPYTGPTKPEVDTAGDSYDPYTFPELAEIDKFMKTNYNEEK